MPPRSGATAGSACLPSAVAATPWLSVLLYGLASRKSFTIGTMTAMRCISVTWVVLGKMAKREAERGRRSPWTSPPFSRNISATCSSRMPSASPKMKNMGNVVAFSLSAPRSCPFEADHLPRLGEFGDPAGPVVRDGHERAVEQRHRIAASVDFVVHFQPVDRRVARRWLFLRRYDSRHEHHQE